MRLPTDSTYTYRLIKMSKPGWVRHFDCIDDLENVLEDHICSDCIREFGYGLYEMLCSPCGCEFAVEDELEFGPTEFEEIEEKLWKQDT